MVRMLTLLKALEFLSSHRDTIVIMLKNDSEEVVLSYIEEIHLLVSLSGSLLPLVPKSELASPRSHPFLSKRKLTLVPVDDEHWFRWHTRCYFGTRRAVSGQRPMEPVCATADGQRGLARERVCAGPRVGNQV